MHGVRTAAAAGCRTIVLTNGCGGLKETWQPGTPVLISDHINLTGDLARSRAPTSSTSPTSTARGCARCAARSTRASTRASTSSSPARTTRRPPRSGWSGVHRRPPGRHEHDARGDRGPRGRAWRSSASAWSPTWPPASAASRSNHEEVLEAGRPRPRRMGDLLGRSSRGSDVRVLVTGAAGSLGRTVTVGLVDRGHDVVGLDLLPEPEGFDGRLARRRLRRPRRGRGGLRGRAARRRRPPRRQPRRGRRCPTRCVSHVVTTAALLDAMVEHGVRRIVYASSNHAVGRTPRATASRSTRRRSPGPTRTTASPRSPPRPCCGSSPTGTASTPSPAGSARSWRRSPSPCATCPPGSPPTTASAWSTRPSPPPPPASPSSTASRANTRAWWDLEPGRRLGYDPQDDAEEFADQVAPGPHDTAESAYVGGPLTDERYHRAAIAGGPSVPAAATPGPRRWKGDR